jgi:hypothetical protein
MYLHNKDCANSRFHRGKYFIVKTNKLLSDVKSKIKVGFVSFSESNNCDFNNLTLKTKILFSIVRCL